MAFVLKSPAFAEGSPIPRRYTCEGEDLSPPLEWEDPPAGTRAFALAVEDPDAPRGVFVHWVLYNLPGDARSLPEGVPARERLESGALQGRNDFGRIGYGGPCPPRGHGTHRYFFTLYALDAPVDLPPGADLARLRRAMEGHILGQARVMGTYRRD